MKRTLRPDFFLSLAVVSLAFLTAFTALAQVTGVSQSSAQLVASRQQNAKDVTQTLGALTLRGGSEAAGATIRPEKSKLGAAPMDGVPPLFLPVVAYSSGGLAPCSIAVADLNGDLKPDLVVANCDSGDVGVLLGNGDGTFQPVVTYPSGGAIWVVIADLNNDGKPDVVVATGGGIGVLLGNGDGTFQPVVFYGSGGGGSFSVAVGDLRGNRILDVVVANSCIDQSCDGSVGVLLGNGDGTFQPAVTYPTGYSAMAVAVGDLNGDGKADMVVGSSHSVCGPKECYPVGQVGVFPGKGDGTFEAATDYPSGEVYPDSLAIADLRGDGKFDVVAASMFSSAVSVLLGNGDGTLQPVVIYGSGGSTDGWRGGVAVADVNRDGKLDLVAVDSGSGEVGVLLGNGDGTFQTAQTYGSGCEPWSVAVADVNNDGGPDLVVANACKYDGGGPTSVGVLLHAGTTSTTTALVSSLNPAAPSKEVTYNAVVVSQGGGAVTGSVRFEDGGSTVATVPIANNQAAYGVTYRKGGVHAITAVYSGDLQHAASISPPLTEYVETYASKTALATSGSPSQVGQPVTFTATVTSKIGAPADGELLTFYDGKSLLGSVPLSGGTAIYTTSALSVKEHTFGAAYPGDSEIEPSEGKIIQIVEKYATTTTLSSNLNPSQPGEAVTFTMQVTSSGPTATGKATFKDGTKTLGSVTLQGGKATLTTSKLALGTHPITAEYPGDAYNAESTSSILDQVVQ